MGRERQNLEAAHSAGGRPSPSARLGVVVPGRAPSPEGDTGAKRGQVSTLRRKCLFPSAGGRGSRRTRTARWEERRGDCRGAWGFRQGGWGGDPGPPLCTTQAFRSKWRGGEEEGERSRRRRTTPELPDQVIAVRCQSAAEGGERGGTCVGSERDGTERERQSRAKPRPPLQAGLGNPAWPCNLPRPVHPHCGPQPSTANHAAGTHALGDRWGAEPREEPKLAQVHTADPNPAWLWALWVLIPEAAGLWLGDSGRPPSPGTGQAGQDVCQPRAQKVHLVGTGAGLSQAGKAPEGGQGLLTSGARRCPR